MSNYKRKTESSLDAAFVASKICTRFGVIRENDDGTFVKRCWANGCRRRFTTVNETRMFCDHHLDVMCRLSTKEMVAMKKDARRRAWKVTKGVEK